LPGGYKTLPFFGGTLSHERLLKCLALASIYVMRNHTAKQRFTVQIVAAIAAVGIPVIGILGAATAAAQPVDSQPKASCTWNGQTTSDGGYHTETSGTSWAKYKCVDGTWVKESSCDGNCNPPPPKTNPTGTKGGFPTRVIGVDQRAALSAN
jgi:hypothetical protein